MGGVCCSAHALAPTALGRTCGLNQGQLLPTIGGPGSGDDVLHAVKNAVALAGGGEELPEPVRLGAGAFVGVAEGPDITLAQAGKTLVEPGVKILPLVLP